MSTTTDGVYVLWLELFLQSILPTTPGPLVTFLISHPSHNSMILFFLSGNSFHFHLELMFFNDVFSLAIDGDVQCNVYGSVYGMV